MTAISLPNSAARRVRARQVVDHAVSTRLRVTMRGRRVIAATAALPAVVALTVAMVSGGAALASPAGGAPTASFATVTVMSGESLWEIAQEIAPHHDPRDVVAGIVRLNALDTVTVTAGQALAVPSEYAPAR